MQYLLLIDAAGNVVLCDVDNEVRMPIGDTLDPSEQARVTTATWSPVGEWTAWSVESAIAGGLQEIRLHNEATDEASVLAEAVGAFCLSPSPCGRWLSHLSPGPLGLELAVSEVLTGELRVIERGQPLFWSWSPDATSIAVHVENRVLIAFVDGSEPQLLSDEASPFVAPWWLPGGSVAFAVADRIVTCGPDGEVYTLIDQATTGRFSLDPEGRRIAHIADTRDGHRLVVVDVFSGKEDVVTTEPVGGFFWSPDGSRLGALIGAPDGLIRWIVFDGSEVRRLPPFAPNPAWTSTVLPFFEQYAQSHTHWSHDNKLVVPAIDGEGVHGALIQGADRPDHSQWIPDADLVWWA